MAPNVDGLSPAAWRTKLMRRKTPLYLTLLLPLLLILGACRAANPPVDPTPAEIPPTQAPPVQLTPIAGEAMIAVGSATVLESPAGDAPERGTLGQGTVVTILAKTADGAWRLVEVTLPGGGSFTGWVETRALTDVVPTDTAVPPTDTPPPPTNTPPATPTHAPPPTATTPPSPTPTPSVTPSPTITTEPTITPTPSTTPSPTATNTRWPTVTPTHTSTPTAAPTQGATGTPTATPSGGAGPLMISVSISWSLAPDNPDEAIASVSITATGGGGGYKYYRDDILQDGPQFTYRWRVCRANPVSFRVESADGQSVTENRFETPPCPTPTPSS